MIHSILSPIIVRIAWDPVNLLIGASAGLAALAYILFASVQGRSGSRMFEAPGPLPAAAIHYDYPHLGKGRKLLPAFVAVIVNSVMVGRAAQRAVEAAYGAKQATGITSYSLLRAMQPRRMRRPPAQVKRSKG